MAGGTFTADDLTSAGDIAIDASHAPNGAQSGIGTVFNKAARRKLIEFTGDIKGSAAQHRKGGMIRIWRGTEAGVLWARSILRDFTKGTP